MNNHLSNLYDWSTRYLFTINDDFLRSPCIKSNFEVQIEMKDPKSLIISNLKGYKKKIFKNSRCRGWYTFKKNPVDCDFQLISTFPWYWNTCMMVSTISTVLKHFINNPAIFLHVLWSWKHYNISGIIINFVFFFKIQLIIK